MSPPSGAIREVLPLPSATFCILLAALRLSAGTLYRSIARMVEQGLIAETNRRRTAARASGLTPETA